MSTTNAEKVTRKHSWMDCNRYHNPCLGKIDIGCNVCDEWIPKQPVQGNIPSDDIADVLEHQSKEICHEGHNGWGNTMIDAAKEIRDLRECLKVDSLGLIPGKQPSSKSQLHSHPQLEVHCALEPDHIIVDRDAFLEAGGVIGFGKQSSQVEAKPAHPTDNLPFPDCSSKCGAVELLGVGECESLCPRKFDKEGNPIKKPALKELVIPECVNCLKINSCKLSNREVNAMGGIEKCFVAKIAPALLATDLLTASDNLQEFLITHPSLEDIPDEIWEPFSKAISAEQSAPEKFTIKEIQHWLDTFVKGRRILCGLINDPVDGIVVVTQRSKNETLR